MMILIVNDQYDKVETISSILSDLGEESVEVVMSAYEALAKMQEAQYDLVILDLQIPMRLGTPVETTGGQKLLEMLELRGDANRPVHVVGITEYGDSLEACSGFFESRGWALVYAAANENELRTVLETKVRHAAFSLRTYDVAILTAVEDIELSAVLQLPYGWQSLSVPGDCNLYQEGALGVEEGRTVSVVAASCARVGLAHAAATAMKLCLRFQPQYLLMVGITAGIEGKTRIGDVLIADPCWDWGSAKLTASDGVPQIMNEPYQIVLDPRVRALAKRYVGDQKRLESIYFDYRGRVRPEHELSVHVGPMASGAAVIEDPEIVDRITSQHRKTIGIEMEAYGVMTAASCVGAKAPVPIVMKSVSDFANPWKDDRWQEYGKRLTNPTLPI